MPDNCSVIGDQDPSLMTHAKRDRSFSSVCSTSSRWSQDQWIGDMTERRPAIQISTRKRIVHDGGEGGMGVPPSHQRDWTGCFPDQKLFQPR